MTTPIEKYVSLLRENELQRDSVRERLGVDGLDDQERDRLDGEVVRLNGELEKHARLLNEELRAAAQRGHGPKPPAQLDQIRDPELRGFCAQVKQTLERLHRLEAEKGARATQERSQVARDRTEARRIIRESE